MTMVRDKTYPKSEYKGRLCDAYDYFCPCRPCYNCHNCSRDPYSYYKAPDMRCATRENGHCHPKETKVEHVFTPRGKVCKRCGARRGGFAL